MKKDDIILYRPTDKTINMSPGYPISSVVRLKCDGYIHGVDCAKKLKEMGMSEDEVKMFSKEFNKQLETLGELMETHIKKAYITWKKR